MPIMLRSQSKAKGSAGKIKVGKASVPVKGPVAKLKSSLKTKSDARKENRQNRKDSRAAKKEARQSGREERRDKRQAIVSSAISKFQSNTAARQAGRQAIISKAVEAGGSIIQKGENTLNFLLIGGVALAAFLGYQVIKNPGSIGQIASGVRGAV